ncbi:hypothetical protein GCM10011506_45630 [Marivirga lumbricoides]|uniref:Uncharacterized protein n=1 Tax=Marivirga lumbricoides TaxID=1046115 RepID=A0ABQ1N5T3_9BACT|nr:hypothetical protein GCM10011506_45630 [Marivirga lumbricoides]
MQLENKTQQSTMYVKSGMIVLNLVTVACFNFVKVLLFCCLQSPTLHISKVGHYLKNEKTD